ncbi:MAG: hypothetical protein MUC72_07830 [Acidobacteria bacterium]|jgi:hypothetical protein|nr:hypothetical protein [Acidobacteriota bacterium]
MRAKPAIFLFVFMAATLAAFPIEAFRVTGVSLSVSEPEFTGACPHRFVFTGRISANREGTVRYRWLRSDGSVGGEQTLVFATAGTQTVSNYWELGAGMGTYNDRWMQVEITAPNSRLSSQAKFSLKCIPQVQVERTFYTISGRLISYATEFPFLDILDGAQLKVRLTSGSRLIKEKAVTLTDSGFASYSIVLLNAPGTYRLTVEPVSLPERMIWQRTDPVSHTVVLTKASPTALNNNFTFYYALTGML